jgi:hypothetical protein
LSRLLVVGIDFFVVWQYKFRRRDGKHYGSDLIELVCLFDAHLAPAFLIVVVQMLATDLDNRERIALHIVHRVLDVPRTMEPVVAHLEFAVGQIPFAEFPRLVAVLTSVTIQNLVANFNHHLPPRFFLIGGHAPTSAHRVIAQIPQDFS